MATFCFQLQTGLELDMAQTSWKATDVEPSHRESSWQNSLHGEQREVLNEHDGVVHYQLVSPCYICGKRVLPHTFSTKCNLLYRGQRWQWSPALVPPHMVFE